MFNPNKKMLDLRGEEMPKSFPTRKELDALPKKDGKPDVFKLEKETVGNVILNCLANYIVRDKKEGFYINLIAQSIISGEQIDFKDKIKKFLIEVLDETMLRREIVTKVVKDENGKEKEVKNEEVKGIYAGFAIAQVKQEMGIQE